MKIDRLLETILILLNRKTVTAGELANKFGVSVRTVYRDMDALSAAGIPVYTAQGAGGGISIMEGYSLSRVFFSPKERESLKAALKSLNAVSYPELESIINKLGVISEGTDDWLEIDFSAWGETDSEKSKFADIKLGIIDKRLIRFEYINAEGERSERTAEPMKLMFKENAWYLSAYCRKRHENRTFRISRMKGVEVLPETFRMRAQNQTDAEEKPYEKIFLELKFEQKVLSRICDIFVDSLITREQGAYFLRTHITESEWLYGYIMSLGASAEVKSPSHLRKEIARRFKSALIFYSDGFSIMT